MGSLNRIWAAENFSFIITQSFLTGHTKDEYYPSSPGRTGSCKIMTIFIDKNKNNFKASDILKL